MSETINIDQYKEELKEVGINEEKKNIGDYITNFGDVLKKVLTVDNTNKLEKLANKFNSKLQNDLSNGRIKPSDLFKQTMDMIGGMHKQTNHQNMAAQAEQMRNSNPQLRETLSGRGGNTRDRLQKKLEKRSDGKK